VSRALQCLLSFQNFLEERGFEKVKNGRSRPLHNLRFIRLMLKTKGIQAGNPNCYNAFTENELDAFPSVLLFVVLHSLMVNDKL